MKTPREQMLAQLVLQRLGEDQRACGQTIDVSVLNGDVVLAGWCDTPEQKAAAAMLARGICGEHSIVDRIQVRRVAQAI